MRCFVPSAVVEAGDKAVLAFRVSGQLDKVVVDPGDNVKRGQTLAHLNTDQLRLLVEQAQANYELANVQYKRDRELLKTNVVSELDFDRSKAERNQAKAELEKAQANLKYATLIAPYDGTLSLSLIENYEYVTAKQPVMHIQSAGLINVTFQLPDQLLTRFQHSTGFDIKPVFRLTPSPISNFLPNLKSSIPKPTRKPPAIK
ncbi:probable Co/Zn/Cd efflux system membrane fusion protein [Photobacterium aphoticum]|uniref:Probable Co/Zn/Cd efflux system membrane fusion protein n=1 Tax=Photobacterium aphoticum TaxID=754436 RepID=A0A090QTE6_9GAMM|nr:probable Co/Zn/Cd efflux system membrane fusion protein [Photobacterium aphoticum]